MTISKLYYFDRSLQHTSLIQKSFFVLVKYLRSIAYSYFTVSSTAWDFLHIDVYGFKAFCEMLIVLPFSDHQDSYEINVLHKMTFWKTPHH